MESYLKLDLVRNRVSLIVPCYNVEKYLEDFIASVITQTYKNLEVILVNDGANDATTQMLRDAVPRLEAEGYVVKLIEQANKGLGGAVDAGLKYFTGEFLMWPDPDDWLMPYSLERRVALMHDNPDVGLLRSNAKLFVEERQEFDGYFMPVDIAPTRTPELFEDLIFMRSFYAPICHMVRSDMFLKVNPNRSIYFSPESSQNFQLLIPLLESCQVLQVHEPLAVYRVREDSRSRAPNKTRESLMSRFDQLLELSERTLPKLKTYTKERHMRVVNFHWRNRMLPTAFRASMRERCVDMVRKSSLSDWRKEIALRMIALQCAPRFRAIDVYTGRIASRLIARTFDWLVRLPHKHIYWGASRYG